MGDGQVVRPVCRRDRVLGGEVGADTRCDRLLAGGQSLLPVLRMRLNAPEVVIDLGKIEALLGTKPPA